MIETKEQAINAAMHFAGYKTPSDFIDYLNNKYSLTLTRESFYLFYNRGKNIRISHALLFEALDKLKEYEERIKNQD